MQDYIRTSTYQRAILDNSVDFAGKVRLARRESTRKRDFAVDLGRARCRGRFRHPLVLRGPSRREKSLRCRSEFHGSTRSSNSSRSSFLLTVGLV